MPNVKSSKTFTY